eukprot:TRINITY_DN22676_c1_g2_i1.p1 TRINITY_DN22676_c1_g2~~TRINITY_DN22676_c1_g2_i1.p1  ORF type:complete len:406 (+),score=133.11 TRINITY_DN22676_c1_g2_i1:163-1380(+)
MGAEGGEGADGVSLRSVQRAAQHYAAHSLAVIRRLGPQLGALHSRHRQALPDLGAHTEALQGCVEANASFLRLCCDVTPQELFEEGRPAPDSPRGAGGGEPSEVDMDRARGLLRQMARDWSAEGRQERRDCYLPLLRELEGAYPLGEVDRGRVRVLSPGCGLGRLSWEIARLGFCSQGNECSMFMLLGADYALNRCREAEAHRIYPYAHQTTNVVRRADQVREVRVPDACPAAEAAGSGESAPPGDLSIVAGDFVEVYSTAGHKEKWDCVATCFFIDTARNIFEYLDTLLHVLPVGGHWINLGPLLYHFSSDSAGCLELTLEDLRHVILSYGFDIVREETVKSTYTSNQHSMLQVMYRNVFMHCVKTGRPRSFDHLSAPPPPRPAPPADVSAERTTVLRRPPTPQ